MKIAFFCNELPPRKFGGIYTATSILVDELLKKGVDVLFIEDGERTELKNISEGINKITVWRCKIRFLGPFIFRVYLWYVIHRLWLKGLVDIVEVPDFEGYLPFPMLLPTVVRLHNTTKLMNARKKLKTPISMCLYEYLTLKNAKIWIAPSQFIYEQTQVGFKINHSCNVISNPVAKKAILFTKRENRILFAGTLTEAKGVYVLAEALLEILPKNPNVTVTFAGRDTLVNSVSTMLRIKSILSEFEDRVFFTGHVSHNEIIALMQSSLVFVFPSKFEAFGLVVAEAMLAKLPVVYTKHPPGPELIFDGVTGILVDPEDPKDIASAVCKLLSDKNLYHEVSSAAYEYAQNNFDSVVCAQKNLEIYRKLL